MAFGSDGYPRRTENTAALLHEIGELYRKEGLPVPYTMADFQHDYAKKHFARLTAEEQREALQALPPERQQELLQALSPEQRLAGLSEEEIRRYLDGLTADRRARPRKPRRKK